MEFISINCELQDIKKRIAALGKHVIKIEKVGNGNMSAFVLYYQEQQETQVKQQYFWRHDVERLISIFEAEQQQ
jgi:hypothetical protein